MSLRGCLSTRALKKMRKLITSHSKEPILQTGTLVRSAKEPRKRIIFEPRIKKVQAEMVPHPRPQTKKNVINISTKQARQLFHVTKRNTYSATYQFFYETLLTDIRISKRSSLIMKFAVSAMKKFNQQTICYVCALHFTAKLNLFKAFL